MQDKLIAIEDRLIEDFEDEGSAEDQQISAPNASPMIEITHFDETDHPANSYRRPLHSFL